MKVSFSSKRLAFFILAPVVIFTLFNNCGKGFTLSPIDSGLTAQSSVLPISTVPPAIVFNLPTQTFASKSSNFAFAIVLGQGSEIQSVMCTVDVAAPQDCSSQMFQFQNLSDGEHTLKVVAMTKQGLVGQGLQKFYIDTTPPVLFVSKTPTSISNLQIAQFLFSATDALTITPKLTCSLDGAAYSSCTSPYTTGTLAAGAHNLRIIATDNLGNSSPEYKFTWTIDLTAPTVTISANPPINANSTTASLTFTGSAGVLSFECQLDASAFAACTSPMTYNNLANGSHTFAVRGKTVNATTSPLSYTWVVDTVPPMITFTDQPAATGTVTAGKISFTVTDISSGLAKVQCSFNNGALADCTSPYSYTAVIGTNSLSITATDRATNLATSKITWTVNAPPVQLTGTQLYTKNCAACHGDISVSAVRGKSADQVVLGIASVPAMKSQPNLVQLTATEINLIVAALNGLEAPAVETGPSLYAANCASCHGALATSTKLNRTSAQITGAIASIPAMSSSPLLGKLSAAQIDLISAALKVTAPDLTLAELANCNIQSVGKSYLRRLNTNELQFALSDLLGLDANTLAQFFVFVPADSTGPSGFSNDGSGLTLSPVAFEKFLNAIESTVNAALVLPNSPFLQCAVLDANCARTKLNAFAQKAYRRTILATELDDLVKVYTANQDAGYSKALSYALQAILISPKFFFVTTFSGGATAKGKALSQSELATRLSLLLWNSLPDDALISDAMAGNLKNPTVLKAQVVRMLADPKSKRMTGNLFGEWLRYNRVASPDLVTRNGLTPQLRSDMIGETSTFFNSIVSDDKSLMDMITANYTFVNSTLATHYGIAGVTGTNFQRVSLVNTPRKGVLSQASVVTTYATPSNSNPIARGHFLMEQVMCSSPPPPPVAFTNIFDPTALGDLTVRQGLEQHTKNPTCQGCHSVMDPLGLAFETFDQLGKYRTVYNNNKTVDATGTVFNKSFSNSSEMIDILQSQAKVRSCMASKVLSYALNRKPNVDDQCLGAKIAFGSIQDTSKFSDLIFQIVTSDTFNFNNTDSTGN